MNICLVRPGIVSSVSAVGYDVCLPLNIAYLAANLRKEGWPVSVVDAIGEATNRISKMDGFPYVMRHGLSDEEVVKRIPRNADVIGISVMFSVNWVLTRGLIQMIREYFPEAILIIGGEHATALPEYCLRDAQGLDMVVLGEGERTFNELLTTLRDNGERKLVSGLAYLEDGKLVLTGKRKRERQLDELPWPAWDLLPMESYFSNNIVSFGLDYGRTMPILASRGCPYECTFCTNPVMWGRLWRVRDPLDVIAEIEHYVTEFKATNFDFFDLTAILKRSWIIEFCNLLIDRNLNITWQLPVGTRSEVIDAEVTRLLFQSGCKYIGYAPESGSENVRKQIKKMVNKTNMMTSMHAAVGSGISVKLHFVMGFPDDSHFDIFASYWMAMQAAWIGASDAGFFPFSPYPGSALFDRLVNEGGVVLNDDFFMKLSLFTNFSHLESYAKSFSNRRLRWLCLIGMGIFYSISFLRRPQRAWKLCKEVYQEESMTKLGAALVRLKQKRRKVKNIALVS